MDYTLRETARRVARQRNEDQDDALTEIYAELDEDISSESDSDEFGFGGEGSRSKSSKRHRHTATPFFGFRPVQPVPGVVMPPGVGLAGFVQPVVAAPIPEEPVEPEKELPLIQQIIGVKGDEDTIDEIPEEDRLYYVKWTGKSYIHCTWMDRDTIMDISGGEQALRKFGNRLQRTTFTSSQSIDSLLMLESDELNSSWLRVERVIAINKDGEYLVKWCGLGYDQCTWESKEDIQDDKAIQKFHERKMRSHPIFIERPRMVDPRTFASVADPLTDPSGTKLRDYQVFGVNWLRYCWYNRLNSILADEMGLGKTVQIVATLNDIAVNQGISGPFLVMAPLSTLPHWRNEFERWSKLNPVVYHGSPACKEVIQQYELAVYDREGRRIPNRIGCDVVITNYETFLSDAPVFQGVQWRYLVLDEGHRLKNHSGKCYKELQRLRFEHCTLLTGTPVQNNVEELWSLLHFLHPNYFRDLPSFMQMYGTIDNAEKLAALQKLIKPFLLRRKKSDVDQTIAAKEETIIEVELTRTQKACYRALLSENAGTLLSRITGQALNPLLNLMMQLRKVCNHPFLLKGMTDQIENQFMDSMGKGEVDEEVQLKAIVESSGKMILINKLLPKLKEGGHKVLIFSQMVKVLDILADYLALLNYPTERIDGRVPENERQLAIEKFAQDPNSFVFLLCTRAGGVGINLTAADTVIIFDSDWNPQNDLQAESRCHRIGQTATVKVYRLVTRGTYEMDMLDRASKKLGLDHALLDGGEINPKQRPMAAKEVEVLLRRGVYDIANEDDTEIEKFSQANIDQILESRTTSYSRMADGNSVFSKAKFDTGEENLDMDAEDFWAQVMPQLQIGKDEELSDRRCKRRNRTDFLEGSDDERKIKRKRKPGTTGQATSPKSMVNKLMHYGYTGAVMEKALISYFVRNLEEPLPEEDLWALSCYVDVADINEPTEEMLESEKKFSPGLEEYAEKKEGLLKRLVFYYRVGQVLTAVQEPISHWPGNQFGSDPVMDYAILYGVYKNGLGCSNKVFDGVAYDAGQTQLTDKQVQKICLNLIANLDSYTSRVTKLAGDFLEVPDWKATHEEILNRKSLCNEEISTLFQTLVLVGFPRKEGEVDWDKVLEMSGLKCIDVDIIKEQGIQMLKLNTEELSQEESFILLDKLGTCGNQFWLRKFRSNCRALDKIRRFVANMTSESMEQLEKLKEWDAAPSWWNAKHDLALVKAISDYGLCYVATWVLDINGPFLEHIAKDLKKEYVKIAEIEAQKGRTQKPKDGGELSFLFNEKLRLTRATSIVDFVENKADRQKRLGSKSTAADEEASYFQEITEIPPLPIEISNQIEILDLGHYTPVSSQYPVGYKCRRSYFSLSDPTEKSWYEASTELSEDGRALQFRVTHLQEPYLEFVSHTSSGVWEKVIQELQNVRTERKLKKRQHTTVSGPFMYGFSQRLIIGCFRLMKANDMDVQE